MKKILILLALLACSHSRLIAQVLYGTYTQSNTTYFAAIDVSTCTSCVVAEWPVADARDMSILPDGRVAIVGTVGSQYYIRIYTLPDPNPITVTLPHIPNGTIVFNDLMYIHTTSGLYVFDPATDQISFVGPWPAAMPLAPFEFYELGGQVYAIQMGNGPKAIWQVDLQNPQNSVFVQNTPAPPGVIGSAASVNETVYLGANPGLLLRYDAVANTFQQECDLNAMGIFGVLTSLSFLPAGLPAPPCICTTQAGSMQPANFVLCSQTPVQATHNGNAVLDGNDLLGFILFSDPDDALGSILFTASSPVFNFAPPLQYGQTYYIAAIAGNNLNGVVDLNDPCLNISNAVTVTWLPLPSLTSITTSNSNACPGACREVFVTFSGTPPFTLSGDLLSNGVVVGNFMETFNSASGQFTVCIPPGTNSGGFLIIATSLTDENCFACD